MTWSPFLRLLTPDPVSTTMPAPSWPRMAGNSPSGSAPERVYLSVWQIPVALSSTSTSPWRGPSSATVLIVNGIPALWATAARTCMEAPLGLVTECLSETGGTIDDRYARSADPRFPCLDRDGTEAVFRSDGGVAHLVSEADGLGRRHRPRLRRSAA